MDVAESRWSRWRILGIVVGVRGKWRSSEVSIPAKVCDPSHADPLPDKLTNHHLMVEIGVIAAAIEAKTDDVNFALFSHGYDFNAEQSNLSPGTSGIWVLSRVYACTSVTDL